MRFVPSASFAVLLKRLSLCFAVAFGAAFVLLFANQVLLLAVSFPGKHLSARTVMEMALFSLPSVAVLAIRFGVCAGFFLFLFRVMAEGPEKEGPAAILPVLCAALVLSAAGFVIYEGIHPKTTGPFMELFHAISPESRTRGNIIVWEAGSMNSDMIFREMARLRDGLGGFSSSELNLYALEFHKRFAIPLGALFFGFFAFAFALAWGKPQASGLPPPRRLLARGILVSVAVCVLDWGLSVGGQYLSLRLGRFGALAAWLPDFALLAASLPLFLCFRSRLGGAFGGVPPVLSASGTTADAPGGPYAPETESR